MSKPLLGLVPAAHASSLDVLAPPSVVPPPPGLLGLRRAAEIVEGAAYDLAGKESADFVSRLIEIAAELDRHARARVPVCPDETVTLLFRAD